MIRKIFLFTYLSITYLIATSLPAYSQIVADHNAVDQYEQIPDFYLNEVKKMWLNVVGQSHSRGYRQGLQLLAAENPRYAVNVIESGEPETLTSEHLRMSNVYRTTSDGWGDTAGEEFFWTSQGAVDFMNNHLSYNNSVGNPVSVFGFGWCWDMNRDDGASADSDDVYGVHWYGTANVGRSWGTSQTWWGIDADDNFDGNHPITLQNYLNAIESYNTSNPQTLTFYSTGPVDGSSNDDEAGYQRYLKHEAIRAHVNSGADRVLFDYADILTHNDAGEQNLIVWNGHSYPFIHPENADTPSHDHISDQGAIRIAKAMWWMLARIAGWDGVGTDKVYTPVASVPAGDYEDGITVSLTCPTEDAIIYYTIDGSEPDEASFVYESPILISLSSTLKAKAFKDGVEASNTFSAHYNIIIDVTPPAISTAEAKSPTEIEIVFDEEMRADDLSNISNFYLNNGVSVISAVPFDAPCNGVTLTVSELTEDVSYTLTVNNVRDDHNNAISENSTYDFIYTVFHAPESLQQHWNFESSVGITVNGAIQTEGKSGKAYLFDGANAHLNLGNSTHNIEETNEFTLTAWIKYNSALTGNIVTRGQYVFPYRMTTAGNRMRSVIRTDSTNYVSGLILVAPDVWNHVALSYKDGERTMYVNGEIDHQSVVTGPLYFGGDQDIIVGEGFNGVIDELQIYNRALTPEQIQGLYSEDIPQYVQTPEINPASGTYTSDVTVTLSCDTEGASIYYTLDGNEPTETSSLYTTPFSISSSTEVNARAFKDGMTESEIVTANYTIETDSTPPEIVSVEATSNTEVIVTFNEAIDSEDITNLDNYSIDGGISIISISSSNSITAVIQTSELTLNHGNILTVNNLKDLAGNEIYNGYYVLFTYIASEPPSGLQKYWDFENTDGITVNGAVQVDNGKSGKAFYFDGVDDQLNLGTSTYNISDSNEFTISAWINYEDALSGNIIIRGAYVYPYRMTTSGNYIRSVIRTNSTNYVRGSIPLTESTWHHVVLSYKDGERTMYVDGAIDEQSVVTGSLNTYNDSQSIIVGEGFKGMIDEIKIYNSALSSAQVNDLYNENIIPQVAQPTITPDAGTYNEEIAINIETQTSDGVIYYTVDGSDPDNSSTLYQGAFNLSTDATIKAIAYKEGMEPSTIFSSSYTFEIDSYAPEITAIKTVNEDTIEITFDEVVDESSAENTANYSVISGIPIISANLNDDNITVTINLGPIPENVEQTLLISSISDLYGNIIENPINANFTYIPISTDDFLTAYWNFDEVSGDSVIDLSGYGNNGVISNATRVTDGISGGAIQFDGDDTVDLGTSHFGVDDTSEYSISIWFKPEQSFAGHLIRRGQYVYPFRIYANAGRVSSTVRTGGTNYLHSNFWPDTNIWHHCLVTYKSGEHNIYINGVLNTTDADVGAPNFYGTFSTLLGEGYVGVIDELKIYNKALDAEEALSVYQNN